MKITKIKPPTSHIWKVTPDYPEYIGEVNEYEFNQFRIHLMENKPKEEYFITDTEMLSEDLRVLDNLGQMDNWKGSSFNLMESQMHKITSLRCFI